MKLSMRLLKPNSAIRDPPRILVPVLSAARVICRSMEIGRF